MTLIKSISGIRGTIGGTAGDNLTPPDVVKFAAAYGVWLKERAQKEHPSVVIGRDARISGEMVQQLTMAGLTALGINVIDLGLSTTPTVEIAVVEEKADGGIILTASHNPKEWNALKLLNEQGEFISMQDGAALLEIAEKGDFGFAGVEQLGRVVSKNEYIALHIQKVLDLPLVDVERIRTRKFKIVVDGVNSTGGIAVPALLERLGAEVVRLYCEPNGRFPHNPEPLKEHLTDLAERVVREKADLGIAVDPDVDRLVFMCHDGELFGEEYTLVACADYVLGKTPGNTVSNLSSSRALRDVTEKHGGRYEASAVGEVHVVARMKETGAVIGGEGNGGVIYPALHYGRDALVGIALFLTYLAEKGVRAKMLREGYPPYFMSKRKLELGTGFSLETALGRLKVRYAGERITMVDGFKIDFEAGWVHLRKSNTEPIVRIYTEARTQAEADGLASGFVEELRGMMG